MRQGKLEPVDLYFEKFTELGMSKYKYKYKYKYKEDRWMRVRCTEYMADSLGAPCSNSAIGYVCTYR
jgi:hypothetical protein